MGAVGVPAGAAPAATGRLSVDGHERGEVVHAQLDDLGLAAAPRLVHPRQVPVGVGLWKSTQNCQFQQISFMTSTNFEMCPQF